MSEIVLLGRLLPEENIDEMTEAQMTLFTLLEALNEEYRSIIQLPFKMLTASDFQVVLKPHERIFQLLDDFRLIFLPHRVEMGIGIGQINRQFLQRKEALLDGTAVEAAKKALSLLESKNDYGVLSLMVVGPDRHQLDIEALNGLLAATSFMSASWTKNQEVVLLRLLGMGIYSERFSNKELAQEMGLSPSALTKRIKASGLKIYLRNRTTASRMLMRIAND